MRFSGEMQRTFDVHLASDVISPAVAQRLGEMGFVRDAFIGGTTGVVHPQHFSIHPKNLPELRALWTRIVDLLSQASPSDFYGYAEAEITPPKFRAWFDWKPFDKSVPPPIQRFEYEECPIGRYKDVDIHLTAELDSLDPGLQAVLESTINFHYVDIRRPAGSVVRVYTVQPLGVRRVAQLYKRIAEYIDRAGGLQGKIKLEATCAYARFPSDAPVCPVVVAVPELAAVR
jgi:hypothetical protein